MNYVTFSAYDWAMLIAKMVERGFAIEASAIVRGLSNQYVPYDKENVNAPLACHIRRISPKREYWHDLISQFAAEVGAKPL